MHKLEGRMLNVTNMRGEDFALFSKMVSHPIVMNQNLGRTFTEEEATYFFQQVVLSENVRDGFGYFKVSLSETGAFIGIAAISENETYQAPEIEYMLLPEYWNKGYGTALVQWLLERIRSVNGAASAVAITDPNNTYSRKILLSLGFRSEKTYRNPDGDVAELFRK